MQEIGIHKSLESVWKKMIVLATTNPKRSCIWYKTIEVLDLSDDASVIFFDAASTFFWSPSSTYAVVDPVIVGR